MSQYHQGESTRVFFTIWPNVRSTLKKKTWVLVLECKMQSKVRLCNVTWCRVSEVCSLGPERTYVTQYYSLFCGGRVQLVTGLVLRLIGPNVCFEVEKIILKNISIQDWLDSSHSLDLYLVVFRWDGMICQDLTCNWKQRISKRFLAKIITKTFQLHYSKMSLKTLTVPSAFLILIRNDEGYNVTLCIV